MTVGSLFTQLTRLIGFKAPQIFRTVRSALDYSSRVADAMRLAVPAARFQRAVTDFRTAIQVHESRAFMRETPVRDRIAENIVAEGVLRRDRNFLTTMRVRMVNQDTGEVRHQWVSTYDDKLMSPEEHLAGAARTLEGGYKGEEWQLSVLYVDSVVHKLGFPWE